MDAPRIVDLEPAPTAVIRGEVPMDQIAGFFDASFGALAGVLGAQGLAPAGAAFALYAGPPAATAQLEVGFPVAQAVAPQDDVVASSLPGGRTATAVHAGAFDGLGESWGALMAWVVQQGERPLGPIWEVYVTEPSPDMDPADLRTELFVPLA